MTKRIVISQLTNLTLKINNFAHTLGLVEQSETIELYIWNPSDSIGNRYSLEVRSEKGLTRKFLTERLTIGASECYSMLYPIYLLLDLIVQKHNKQHSEMQSIYQSDQNIFLGDLNSILNLSDREGDQSE